MKNNEEIIEDCGGITPCNGITELVFIIDRSGSMQGLESDTIGGFNSMIDKQRAKEGGCFVSTVLFNDVCKTVHDRISIIDIPKMTYKDYSAYGSTALIDAIGSTIEHIQRIHRYIRLEDVPDNVVFVIMTDGQENSSREYSSDRVKKMIERKKKKGWEFLFIGANIDAVETASGFGIGQNRAVNYHADEKGTKILYESVACAIDSVRTCGGLNEDWGANIDADYKSRKRK